MSNLPSPKNLVAVFVIAFAVALIFFYFKKSITTAEQCSLVGEQTVCFEFKCATGTPTMTIGGSGNCSDGSKPTTLRTWTE